jgi:hypothetical protein
MVFRQLVQKSALRTDTEHLAVFGSNGIKFGPDQRGNVGRDLTRILPSTLATVVPRPLSASTCPQRSGSMPATSHSLSRGGKLKES